MIKKIIMKIKEYWKKFKDFFKPIKYTNEELFEHLFNHICLNRPRYFTMPCHCGSMLTAQDIHEKQYAKDFVWLFWDCKRCNMRIEKRYNFDGLEIKE